MPRKAGNLLHARLFSPQAFVDRSITATDRRNALMPETAERGLDFIPTLAKADEALQWMGFEARSAALAMRNAANADMTAIV